MYDSPAPQDPRSEGRRRARIFQAFVRLRELELISAKEWRMVTKAYRLLEAIRTTPERAVPPSPVPLDPIPDHVLPSLAELVDSMDRLLLPWDQGVLPAWEVRRRLVYWAEEIEEIFSEQTRNDWEKAATTLGLTDE